MNAAAGKCVRDCRGVPVSYRNPNAIVALERAHESYLSFNGDPLAKIDSIIEQHPKFILAYLFKASYLTQVLEKRVRDDLVETISIAQSLSSLANDRERHHLCALQAWVDGEIFSAIRHWEDALVKYPFDLLALQIIHLSYVLFGEVKGQRDVVAKVFSRWDEKIPGFEHVLAFYAFGLEENGDFERAEQMAKHSIELRSNNPYAVHAIAHIMDMQGRYAEGLAFMYDQIELWSESGFVIHLWWHTALMHLDVQDFNRTLEIYDDHLRAGQQETNRYEEFDATALLWRLDLIGVDVGERWVELADKWEPSAKDTLYAFNNVHAMMALVSDSRTDAAQDLLNANADYAQQSSNDNAAAIAAVGLPFCRALEDFHADRYSECVDRLLIIRYRLDLLGGSYVQREVLIWTLLESALRAERFELAVALANERCELKPGSAQRWLDLARSFKGLGAFDSAASAQTRAAEIISLANV